MDWILVVVGYAMRTIITWLYEMLLSVAEKTSFTQRVNDLVCTDFILCHHLSLVSQASFLDKSAFDTVSFPSESCDRLLPALQTRLYSDFTCSEWLQIHVANAYQSRRESLLTRIMIRHLNLLHTNTQFVWSVQRRQLWRHFKTRKPTLCCPSAQR